MPLMKTRNNDTDMKCVLGRKTSGRCVRCLSGCLLKERFQRDAGNDDCGPHHHINCANTTSEASKQSKDQFKSVNWKLKQLRSSCEGVIRNWRQLRCSEERAALIPVKACFLGSSSLTYFPAFLPCYLENKETLMRSTWVLTMLLLQSLFTSNTLVHFMYNATMDNTGPVSDKLHCSVWYIWPPAHGQTGHFLKDFQV